MAGKRGRYERPLIPQASDGWRFITYHRKKYEIQENGCWIWIAGKSPQGYGLLKQRDTNMQCAHRLFYLAAKGEIPENHEVDHLCRCRACVNPEHLEAVTKAVNVKRGYLARK